MAWYAFVSMLVSLVGIAGLIWTVILSNKATTAATTATEAAVRSAAAAEKTYLTENRAWLHLEIKLARTLILNQNGLVVPLIVRSELIGNSPATGVTFWITQHNSAERHRVNEWVNRAKEILSRDYPGTALVTQKVPFNTSATLLVDRAWLSETRVSAEEIYYEAIVVCGISYRSIVSDERHFSIRTIIVQLRTGDVVRPETVRESIYDYPPGGLMT